MAPHGIMLHHFHDDSKHIVEQGSISSNDFELLLDYYEERFNLIGADEFYYNIIHEKNSPTDACVTFDDNLLCQYDVAIPVLNKRKLSAFFFAYTSPLQGKIEKLEIYRHFRHYMFSDIDKFYECFFSTYDDIKSSMNIDASIEQSYDVKTYLAQHSFYTDNDRKFRFIRDEVLGPEKYYQLMDEMISKSSYDINTISKILWCGEKELRDINSHGHLIGLHSHTHPTRLCELDYESQLNEYKTCKDILESCINSPIVSASYPCGSTNADTHSILRELRINIAFKEIMLPFTSQYMIPRNDHTNILKEIKE